MKSIKKIDLVKVNDRLSNLNRKNQKGLEWAVSWNWYLAWRKNEIIPIIIIPKYSFDSAFNKFNIIRNCLIIWKNLKFKVVKNSKILWFWSINICDSKTTFNYFYHYILYNTFKFYVYCNFMFLRNLRRIECLDNLCKSLSYNGNVRETTSWSMLYLGRKEEKEFLLCCKKACVQCGKNIIFLKLLKELFYVTLAHSLVND